MKPSNNNETAISPISYKIVGDASTSSFVREFSTLKAMRQFTRRNPELTATEYVLHNSKWERFVTYGKQVIPEPTLRNLLSSITK